MAKKQNKAKLPNRKKAHGAARSAIGSSELRVNRKKMSVSDLTAPPDDLAYWRSRTPAERLAYMEYLRLINYGEAAVSGRIKKVIEIVQFRPS